MLCGENKVLGSSVGNEINPGFGIPIRSCEIAEKVIVDYIWSVRVKLVVVNISLVGISVVTVPVSSQYGANNGNRIVRISLRRQFDAKMPDNLKDFYSPPIPFSVDLNWGRVSPTWHTVWTPMDENPELFPDVSMVNSMNLEKPSPRDMFLELGI